MRAGRLVSLMLLLQRHGRVTAARLAAELEVSERTILRDIEELSGAGVPVYAVRGPGGGFQLLDGFDRSLPEPDRWEPQRRGPGSARRAVVRISDEGRRRAAVFGCLQPLRRRGTADEQGWVEASFRLRTIEEAATDVLSLAPHVEVLEPVVLRTEVVQRLRAALDRHGS